MAAGKYRTIVADPPWDHSDGTGQRMTLEQFAAEVGIDMDDLEGE